MKRGTRVRVVSGKKSVGVEGTVFWEGPNKYGEGMRLGLKDENEETHWVNADHVEVLEESPDSGPAARPDGPAVDESRLTKGARVEIGGGLTGEIFWVGPNKFGPGLRLGVKDQDGRKHWVDAAAVRLEEEEAS